MIVIIIIEIIIKIIWKNNTNVTIVIVKNKGANEGGGEKKGCMYNWGCEEEHGRCMNRSLGKLYR